MQLRVCGCSELHVQAVEHVARASMQVDLYVHRAGVYRRAGMSTVSQR